MTKSLYSVVDHRAPRYIFRTDPCVQVAVRFFSVATLTVGLVGLGCAALFGGSLVCAGLFLVVAYILWRYLAAWDRYVVRLQDDEELRDHHIQRDLVRMQAIYRRHPDLQALMEPVLLASYGFARELNARAVHARLRAIQDLDSTVPTSDAEVDNADLDELRQILAIRREMRREGLL